MAGDGCKWEAEETLLKREHADPLLPFYETGQALPPPRHLMVSLTGGCMCPQR